MKSGKAVVTGGGQGIGKCIALNLLKKGYTVVIAEKDCGAGEETCAEYRSIGEISFIETDVGNESSVASMMQEVTSRYHAIDLLVNNAALFMHKSLEELTLAEWNEVLAVNLTGVFLCAKYAAPFLKTKKGAIVNIASTRAIMSEADTFPYSASKGGVVALTHALAVSLGPDVRVNCISPGWIETCEWKKQAEKKEPSHTDADRMQHPAGRVGVPDDIAAMVLFLADPANAFISGQNMIIDGGMTKKMIYV